MRLSGVETDYGEIVFADTDGPSTWLDAQIDNGRIGMIPGDSNSNGSGVQDNSDGDNSDDSSEDSDRGNDSKVLIQQASKVGGVKEVAEEEVIQSAAAIASSPDFMALIRQSLSGGLSDVSGVTSTIASMIASKIGSKPFSEEKSTERFPETLTEKRVVSTDRKRVMETSTSTTSKLKPQYEVKKLHVPKITPVKVDEQGNPVVVMAPARSKGKQGVIVPPPVIVVSGGSTGSHRENKVASKIGHIRRSSLSLELADGTKVEYNAGNRNANDGQEIEKETPSGSDDGEGNPGTTEEGNGDVNPPAQ
jgi:hypothetical protein